METMPAMQSHAKFTPQYEQIGQAEVASPKPLVERKPDVQKKRVDDLSQRDPETLTTLILRNIPTAYSQQQLMELMDDLGFYGVYDFIYMPCNFKNGVNLGYAFVNLVSHQQAMRLTEAFSGCSWPNKEDAKGEVAWAHPHQGYEEHVQRYRDSPVMHASIPAEFKPMIFSNGVRIAFPPPTKAIKAPKLRPIRDRTAEVA